MSETRQIKGSRRLLIWMAVLVLVMGGFYGLDHFVMNLQGLPLEWDLSPAR